MFAGAWEWKWKERVVVARMGRYFLGSVKELSSVSKVEVVVGAVVKADWTSRPSGAVAELKAAPTRWLAVAAPAGKTACRHCCPHVIPLINTYLGT